MSKTIIYEKFNELSMPEMQILSMKILEWCNENKVSVLELSDKINLGHMTLRRIVQKSDSYSPNIKILYAIADFFECSILELLSPYYPISIPYYPSLFDFRDNINSNIIKEMVPKSIQLRSKFSQFVKINYYNDLTGIFILSNELPNNTSSPFGCIIGVQDKLHFGYLTIENTISKFHDFYLKKETSFKSKEISIIGIKEI